MRCFIAISLPDSIHNKLSEIQTRLKKYNADIGWTRPEGIHLTLKFLGEISEDKIPPLKVIMEQVSANQTPFELEIGSTGMFPDARRPRVFWVGISQGIEQITKLANQLDTQISELGFPKEERKFNPHLTLGRVRSPKNLPAVTNYFLEETHLRLGKITVEHISLYQSILKSSGAEYIALVQSHFKN